MIGRVDGKLIINPTVEQMEKSDIELIVAGTKDAVNMVEAGANQVREEEILEAIMFGHEEVKRLVEFQEEIAKQVGKEKMEVVLREIDEELENEVIAFIGEDLKKAIQVTEKLDRNQAIDDVVNKTIEHFAAIDEERVEEVEQIVHKLLKKEVRELIIKEKIRPDGRKIDAIRPLSSQVSILPRTHGFGLFTRGQTQVLSTCTLGALGDVQILDGLE